MKNKIENSYTEILKHFYSFEYVKGVLKVFLWEGIVLSIYVCLKSVLLNTIKICLNIIMIPFYPILAIFIKRAYDEYDKRSEEEIKIQIEDKFKLTQRRKK